MAKPFGLLAGQAAHQLVKVVHSNLRLTNYKRITSCTRTTTPSGVENTPRMRNEPPESSTTCVPNGFDSCGCFFSTFYFLVFWCSVIAMMTRPMPMMKFLWQPVSAFYFKCCKYLSGIIHTATAPSSVSMESLARFLFLVLFWPESVLGPGYRTPSCVACKSFVIS